MKKLINGFLLILIIIVSLFFSLELILKVICGDEQLAAISYDKNLVWKYTPNLNLENFSTNSLGFRDQEHQLNKNEGVTRIAFIGDSYTVGVGYSEQIIFPGQISKILEENKNKSYEIFNFGVSAYGTDQEFIALKEFVLKYKPEIVVLTIVPNDIRETYSKKLFYLENETLKFNKGNKAFNLSFFDTAMWSLSTKYHSFFILNNKFGKKYWQFDYIFENITEGVFFKENHYLNGDAVLFLRNETQEMKNATNLFIKLIETMNNLCRENNSTLVIVNLPIKMQFNDTLKNDNLFDQKKISNIIYEVTSKSDIPYLDLYLDINQSNNPLVFYNENEYHLNEKGHKYVGEKIYAFLIEKKLI